MSHSGETSPEIVEVAAGLVFHHGKLLITQRLPTGHLANLWEFPGGKREANESFEECLHRELLEELAIQVNDLELIETVKHAYPEKRVHLNFFKCRLAEGVPQALGCQGFKWVDRSNLSAFEFPAADEILLEHLVSQESHWIIG